MPPHQHEASAAILESIHEKLKKLGVLEQLNGRLLMIENTVGDIERGLSSMKEDLQKVKVDLDLKADNTTVEALKDEIKELQNRSRRNNLVFYNIPEKAKRRDCISFLQDFIMQHMDPKTICVHVTLERVHRTPSKRPSVGEKGWPRQMHDAFLRYTKLGDDRKVYIAYPAILNYVDFNGCDRTVGTEELTKLRLEIKDKELI